MIKITDKQGKILLALSKYKYLTPSQFVELGISDITYTRKVLSQLEKRHKPYIHRLRFGIDPRKGQLESLFYLTKFGKRQLMDGLNVLEEDILMPKGKVTVGFSDYYHRKNTISFHIHLRRWVEAHPSLELEFFDSYFDKIGNARKDKNLRAKNKIIIDSNNYLIPDGIFILNNNGERYLYLFEMYNGKDTKRVIQQLGKHALIITNGSASKKYQVKKVHQEKETFRINRVICVFEHNSIKEATIKRLSEDQKYKHLTNLFLFSDLDGLNKDNVGSRWVNIARGKVNII